MKRLPLQQPLVVLDMLVLYSSSCTACALSLCSAGFQALLRSRAFQAGLKLYLAAASALVVTMLMMAHNPKIRSIVPMFGFTSVCLSMQERVEATTDKVCQMAMLHYVVYTTLAYKAAAC